MILGMSIPEFTLLHVVITLIAIGSGLIAVGGMFAAHRLPGTSALFLFTTVLTSVTGFLFPIHGFTPASGVEIVSCVILLVALFAYYGKHPDRRMALDLCGHCNCSALLECFCSRGAELRKGCGAQCTSEPPFAIAQLAVLGIFIVIGLIAAVTFQPGYPK
jgi:hypothetical protein